MTSATTTSSGSMSSTLRSALSGFRKRLIVLGGLQVVCAALEATTIALLIPFLGAVGAGRTEVDLSLLARLGAPASMSASVSAGILIVACLGRLLLQIVAASYWSQSVFVIEHERRTRLVEAFTAAQWDYQSREPAGKLQQLLTMNAEQVAKAFTSAAYSLAYGVNLLVLAVYAFTVSFVNSVAATVVLAALAFAARPLTNKTRAAATQRAAALAKYAALISRTLLLGKELRVFGGDQWFTKHAGDLSKQIGGTRRTQNLLGAAVPILYQNGSALLLIVGAMIAISFGADSGAASAVVSVLLIIRAVSYGQHLHLMYHQLHECVPYLEQLLDEQTKYDAHRAVSGDTPVGRITKIEFCDVGYSYDGNCAAVSGASFSATVGDIVAVIGPSGAGKSTIAQLLLGLRSPQSGEIRINGVPLGRLSSTEWFSRIALVPQDLVLEGDTVAECIRFHRRNLTEDQIKTAAIEAGIADEIERLPQGFATAVGERGTTLSHGQRQRLCVARALAGSPDLLVFDEPTSSLDAASEANVLSSLRRSRAGRVTFILAHRPATLEISNKVLVLREGRIASFQEFTPGTEAAGLYRELAEASRE